MAERCFIPQFESVEPRVLLSLSTGATAEDATGLLFCRAFDAAREHAALLPADSAVAAAGATPTPVSSPPAGSAPYGADYADNSEFMLGDVWVSVVLLESSGAVDPNQENWTTCQISEVKTGIQAGLDWWETSFTAFADEGGPQYLSFHVDWTYADNPVATPYEPITHSYSWQYYWVHDFLDVVGYNTPDSYTADLTRWNHDQRIAHNTHWAFTIFVVNSAIDADGKFSDGYYAYSYLGGPFMVMTYDNATWDIAGMGQVSAHEIGHVFYALDEYSGSNSYTDRSGYYGVQNLNARDGNPDPASRVPSIMAEPGLQADAWANYTSSPSSLQMVGWRDSDGDGIFDLLDVPPALSGAGSWNPVASQFEFAGTAAVAALDNLNTRGSKHDITINTVDRLRYRLDEGAWQDGNAYGLYSTNVSQEVPVAQNGLHTIEFRTVSLDGVLASNVLSYEFEISGPQSQAPAMVDLAEESDTGFSVGDKVTRLNNSPGKALRFIISGTTPGATVTLYAGDVEIGSQIAVGETTEIITDAATVLADGVHQIVARQREEGSNQSSNSPALQLTVDTAPPPTPAAPNLTSQSDTGASDSDNITNGTATLTLTPGPHFRLYRDGTLVSGDYETGTSWTDPLLADGTYSYAVTVVDLAGNESDLSDVLAVTVCTQPPQAALAAEDITVAGAAAYDLTVAFTHPIGIWMATLADGNVRVSGPGSFLQDAILVGVGPAGDGSPRTATYRVFAPGGTWYDIHNGTYSVTLLEGQVADLAGNYMPAADLGTFIVDVPKVAPQADGQSQTTREDTPLTGTATGSNTENDPLTFAVGDEPSHGSVVMQADGAYVYTPAADYYGPDSFTFRAYDGGLHSDPATVSVTVAPVNDAPSFAAGADLWASRDAGPQSLIGWASAIQVGPANEAAQALAFTVTADDPSFFSVQPAISADGTLIYTPSLTAAGTVRVTVVLRDDGGTGDAGADTSAAQSFDILIARPLPLDRYGRASFTDASGDRVLVYLIGGGTGSVYFASNADSDINRILLTGTGDRSALIICGRTSIGGIESDGSLGRIVAPISDLIGRVRVGAASGQYAAVLMMFANVADADIESATPISSFIVSRWLDTDGVRDRLSAPYAATVVSRGDFQADVTFSDLDRLGNSVSMFYSLGAVSGTNLTLAGGAKAVYAASWTGGAIRAACAGSIVATRGMFSPSVTMTGHRNGLSLSLLSVTAGEVASPSVTLAGGAGIIVAAGWAGDFQAAYVNSVIVRGDLSASLRLTDKGPSGLSMLLLQVTGTLDGAEVLARYGINTVIAASSRNSRVLAGVSDAVAGLPAATDDFLTPADPNKPIAINTLVISSAAGAFENSFVAASMLGRIVLRGVQPLAEVPFGVAAFTQIRFLALYGELRTVYTSIRQSLPPDDSFNVWILNDDLSGN